MRKSGSFIGNLLCSEVLNLMMHFTDLLRAHLSRNIGMEGKWVAAACMKNRDRFAGGNLQVSAIGKHPNNKKIAIECDYCSFYYKFNRDTCKFYELLCSPTEYPEFMDSRTRKGIHGHGGRTKFSTKFSTAALASCL